jgi:putative RecB family exonuclease
VQSSDGAGAADPATLIPTAADASPSAPALPTHLSPSSAGTYDQCARRWRFRYVDRLPDPPGADALVGTFAHRVLELLFQDAPVVRTVDRARDLARQVWPEIQADPDFQALGLDEPTARAFRWQGWRAIEGLWPLEDPTTVMVDATEQHVATTIGDVPFRGIVDRLDRGPDGRLEITDYKSGRAPTPRFAGDRLGQVVLYAAAVEAITAERPRRARLLYLGQKIVDTDITDAVLDPVIGALHDTWGALERDCESGEFEASPGPLCGWCPYADRCPEGSVEVQRRHGLGMLAAGAPALALLADTA